MYWNLFHKIFQTIVDLSNLAMQIYSKAILNLRINLQEKLAIVHIV